MGEEPSQEELLAQQKANCIFCKIVGGEADSKKVFEDEQMFAVLDINPAVKGHTIVLPKEHYPIMPLIPPEVFAHLFGSTAALSGMVREAVLAQRCTLFIANGAIAGQQSPHFLFHLLPREDGDNLHNLSIPANGVNQSDIVGMLKDNLAAVMRQHLTSTNQMHLLNLGTPVEESAEPVKFEEPPPVQTPVPNGEQLAQIIEQNDELKGLLLNNPEKLEQIIKENPQFANIFAGVDLKKLSEQLQQTIPTPDQVEATPEAPATPEAATTPDPPPEEKSEAISQEQPATPEAVKPAAKMSMEELFAFIESKPKLVELLQEPEKLKEIIPTNERLQQFFAGSDVDLIIAAWRGRPE